MFRMPTPQVVRSQPNLGQIAALRVPSKGLNVRDALANMGPEYAISLSNVVVEPYGIRTRKGYTEWATNLPSASSVWTVMSYYPATASPTVLSLLPFFQENFMARMIVSPRAADTPPAGKLFAATNGGRIYDVTAGGVGPWSPMPGVLGPTDFWTWLNFQNLAGSFLIAANNGGGYAYYNGATWTTPVAGTGAGQIDGVDPVKFVYVTAHKKRLWFVEKDSTRAWYLPVGQITGLAKQFNFGEQFSHGGNLAMVMNWTIDGGEGIDDYLIALSSQGDVVIYKGVDPDDPTQWALHGVWYVGALPAGRRGATKASGDIYILSHYGVTPLSMLLQSRDILTDARKPTHVIAPLIARLMRDYATLPDWSIKILPREEMMTIRVPTNALERGGQFLTLKFLTGAWSGMKDVPYLDFVDIDTAIFAGTRDGRVVRAFNGPLDNVKIGQQNGDPILCQVTPAYQPMGGVALQKLFKLVRPTFIATVTPSLKLQILTDYGLPRPPLVPTLPVIDQSRWNTALWNIGRWSGIQQPIKEWLGARGVGFVGTVQLDYLCGGDTLLASVDFWVEQGGVM